MLADPGGQGPALCKDARPATFCDAARIVRSTRARRGGQLCKGGPRGQVAPPCAGRADAGASNAACSGACQQPQQHLREEHADDRVQHRSAPVEGQAPVAQHAAAAGRGGGGRGMGSSGAGRRAALRGTGTASCARAPRAALGGGQAPHQPVPAAPAPNAGRPCRAGGPAGGAHRMLCWKAATRRVQVSASLAPYTISVSCPSRMMRARLPAQAWRGG